MAKNAKTTKAMSISMCLPEVVLSIVLRRRIVLPNRPSARFMPPPYTPTHRHSTRCNERLLPILRRRVAMVVAPLINKRDGAWHTPCPIEPLEEKTHSPYHQGGCSVSVLLCQCRWSTTDPRSTFDARVRTSEGPRGHSPGRARQGSPL